VLVIVGTLTSSIELGEAALGELAEHFGGVELAVAGDTVPFARTDYYEPEMGADLVRWYACLDELMPPERLVELKQLTWQLEQHHCRDGHRLVNLDPGYLDLFKVVLASFKHGPQKLYLGSGVWADPVLYFRDGAYRELPWTFPDLRGGDHAAFFAAARELYKTLLRRQRGRGPQPK
jgi:hypothetical protein